MHQGTKIKQLAYEKGLRQKDLAKLKNVSESLISWELKQEKLAPETLKVYAELLEVNYTELINEESKKSSGMVSVEKMLEVMEENRKLWSVIARHGISVNFKQGVGYVSFAR